MYSVNAGSSDTFSVSEVGTYMLIKISGKLQAAMLCLSQMRPTMTCWVHQSLCNQAEQDNTDLRGCRNAHAKYTLSIRIMEWCFNPRLLLGISHVVFFCSGGLGGSQNSISREPKNVHFQGSLPICLDMKKQHKTKQKNDYSEVIMSLFGLNHPLGKIFKWPTKLKCLTRSGQPMSVFFFFLKDFLRADQLDMVIHYLTIMWFFFF